MHDRVIRLRMGFQSVFHQLRHVRYSITGLEFGGGIMSADGAMTIANRMYSSAVPALSSALRCWNCLPAPAMHSRTAARCSRRNGHGDDE